jgi:23S rRNA (adenine-N6)-dimethyltransferase
VSSVRDRAGARPRGRHLLRSSRLADAIVRDAGVEPGELVVDVGAGSGMLTAALVRAGAHVRAIEPDRLLAERLRRACPGAVVVEADARAMSWPEEPFRVVANLPFAHTTDICRALLSDPRVPLRSADLIVQWEAAVKRTRLWPSTMLGVLWSTWYELSVLRRIAPPAFAPAPGVAGALLAARRRSEPLVAARDATRYEAFLRRSFRSGALPPCARRLAPGLGVDPRAEPRDLDARAWAALWRETSGPARTVGAMTRRGRAR